jgi:ATP synthase protein I
MARNLALVGTLGWLVVAPTLLGAFVGRAIDRVAHTGVTFTAAFLGLGVVVGSWLAWLRVKSE